MPGVMHLVSTWLRLLPLRVKVCILLASSSRSSSLACSSVSKGGWSNKFALHTLDFSLIWFTTRSRVQNIMRFINICPRGTRDRHNPKHTQSMLAPLWRPSYHSMVLEVGPFDWNRFLLAEMIKRTKHQQIAWSQSHADHEGRCLAPCSFSLKLNGQLED